VDDGEEQETDDKGLGNPEQGSEKPVCAADGGILYRIVDNVAYEREQQEGDQETDTDADNLYGKSADVQVTCDKVADDIRGKIGSQQACYPGNQFKDALQKTMPQPKQGEYRDDDAADNINPDHL
jgi:hypothetical protein